MRISCSRSRGIRTKILRRLSLVLPDDVPAHPYAVAIETVRLSPRSEVSIYEWKENADQIARRRWRISGVSCVRTRRQRRKRRRNRWTNGGN